MYMLLPRPISRRLETQVMARAFSRAWAKTGNRMAASIAIIAITTSSSMRVNALLRCIGHFSLVRVTRFDGQDRCRKRTSSAWYFLMAGPAQIFCKARWPCFWWPEPPEVSSPVAPGSGYFPGDAGAGREGAGCERVAPEARADFCGFVGDVFR